MARLRSLLLSLRDLIPAAAPFVLLASGLLALAYWALDPAPPTRLVLSTGAPQGAYQALGERYRDALAAHGIEVELRPSAGSAENLVRLQDAGSGVDVAFVQGGTVPRPPGEDQDENRSALVSLGSLFYEPVWLFYREDSARRLLRRPELRSFAELRGWRLNAGAPGSGVQPLAERLMALNALAPGSVALAHGGSTPAVVELLAGRLDAMLFVSAPEAPLIQMLLMTPGIRLLDFAQAQAYARKVPYLGAVTLPRGVVDLARDLPARDVRLISPTATLAARRDLHPALVQLLMQAASRIHGEAGWFARAGEFPNAQATDLPIADEAARYLKGGAPLLQRWLPFWLSNLIDRMWVALLSIVAVLIPLSRLVPPLYEFRVRSRIFRWYARLREVDDALDLPGADRAALRAELDEVEARASHISVPLSYADELYALRQHIDLMRKRLEGGAPPPAAAQPG